ncbi:MAG: DUF4340 domain-containing protein [Akkermansiaceae bacterium]|nr:DUF4340 domain-containing protein [Akkermansiaceae bacterium]
MRFLPTLFFSLFAIGLGSLAVIQQIRGNLDFIFGAPPLEVGDTVYKFDPDSVGRMHVLNDDGTRAVVIKKGGAWILEEPWQDYADARIVRSIIDFASRLQIEDVIARDDVEDLAEFGLRKNRIEIELFDKSGSPLCHFKIGRYTTWRGFDPTLKLEDPTQRPPSFPTLIIRPAEDEMEDYLYVCSDFADPSLREVRIRDLFSQSLRLFRNHLVFYNAPGFAGEITLKEKNSEITIKRDSMNKEDEWKITKPFELAVSPASLNRLILGLTKLQANIVLDESVIALPEPLLENIEHTISIRYFLPDGSLSPPVTAIFYPSENEQSTDVPVIISEGPGKKRSAILKVPSSPTSILSSIPRSVNTLRSRTMTSLQVKQIESVKVSDFTGRAVSLELELDPHERARRWYARVEEDGGQTGNIETYNGPANIFQVKELFEVLFKDEVESFTNDASTDPKIYGLDQPIRRIKLGLSGGNTINCVMGEKLRPQYFARRADGGRPLEISEEAYSAGIKGESHRELEIVSRPPEPNARPPSGLDLLGLDKPKVATIKGILIHLGQANSRHFFVNRLDKKGNNTPHVVEIQPEALNKMPLEPYHWRSVRLWNINRFEINGLIIKRAGEAALELSYNFYSQEWSATKEGKDVTSLLNPHKAEKLLKKLTDISVQHWIGPIADNASFRLSDPALQISVLIEDIDEEGIEQGKVRRELRLSEVVEGQSNRLYYGKTNSDPNYFLLDAPTFQRLSVELLEK